VKHKTAIATERINWNSISTSGNPASDNIDSVQGTQNASYKNRHPYRSFNLAFRSRHGFESLPSRPIETLDRLAYSFKLLGDLIHALIW